MPEIPKGAKKPSDRAAKSEAKAEDVTLDFNGHTYVIAAESANNIELMEFVEDEKYVSAIRGYLGMEQWKKFKDLHRDSLGRVRADTFEDLLNALMAAIGGGSTEHPNS